jgi:hypothetical protein
MRKTIVAVTLALAAAQAHANTYQAANAKYRDADFVFVMVPSEFFGQAADAQGRQFNAMRTCAKAAKLKGDVVIVASDKGRLRYYADARWTKFLQPLDWAWLMPKLKQQLACKA